MSDRPTRKENGDVNTPQTEPTSAASLHYHTQSTEFFETGCIVKAGEDVCDRPAKPDKPMTPQREWSYDQGCDKETEHMYPRQTRAYHWHSQTAGVPETTITSRHVSRQENPAATGRPTIELIR